MGLVRHLQIPVYVQFSDHDTVLVCSDRRLLRMEKKNKNTAVPYSPESRKVLCWSVMDAWGFLCSVNSQDCHDETTDSDMITVRTGIQPLWRFKAGQMSV